MINQFSNKQSIILNDLKETYENWRIFGKGTLEEAVNARRGNFSPRTIAQRLQKQGYDIPLRYIYQVKYHWRKAILPGLLKSSRVQPKMQLPRKLRVLILSSDPDNEGTRNLVDKLIDVAQIIRVAAAIVEDKNPEPRVYLTKKQLNRLNPDVIICVGGFFLSEEWKLPRDCLEDVVKGGRVLIILDAGFNDFKNKFNQYKELGRILNYSIVEPFGSIEREEGDFTVDPRRHMYDDPRLYQDVNFVRMSSLVYLNASHILLPIGEKGLSIKYQDFRKEKLTPASAFEQEEGREDLKSKPSPFIPGGVWKSFGSGYVVLVPANFTYPPIFSKSDNWPFLKNIITWFWLKLAAVIPQSILYYRDPRWEKVRTIVLKRDHFKCTVCKHRVAKIVHHINSADFNPDLFFDPENLTSMCEDCHNQTRANGIGNGPSNSHNGANGKFEPFILQWFGSLPTEGTKFVIAENWSLAIETGLAYWVVFPEILMHAWFPKQYINILENEMVVESWVLKKNLRRLLPKDVRRLKDLGFRFMRPPN